MDCFVASLLAMTEKKTFHAAWFSPIDIAQIRDRCT